MGVRPVLPRYAWLDGTGVAGGNLQLRHQLIERQEIKAGVPEGLLLLFLRVETSTH